MINGEPKKVDIAYDAIEEMVRGCRLRPGEHIQIGELSHRLNMGVTPVREALFKLKAESFICSDGKRGFASKPIDLDEMRELHEIAEIVLIHAVQRACPRDVAWTRLIEGVHEIVPELSRVGQISDNPEFVELLFAAHAIEGVFASVAALTGNVELSRIVQNFYDKSHFIRLIDLQNRRRRIELADSMERLLHALESQCLGEVTRIIETYFSAIDGRMDVLIRKALMQSQRCATEILPAAVLSYSN